MNPIKRGWLAVGYLGLLGLAASPEPAIVLGQTSVKVAPGGPNLKTTLEKGLRARRKSEFAFIAQVVSLVDEGKLPIKLVNRTFLWARENKQPYPIPYFEEALRRQAKLIGVTL